MTHVDDPFVRRAWGSREYRYPWPALQGCFRVTPHKPKHTLYAFFMHVPFGSKNRNGLPTDCFCFVVFFFHSFEIHLAPMLERILPQSEFDELVNEKFFHTLNSECN